MFEPTLARLGKYLSELSDIPQNQIVYADRELLFNYLSHDNLPMTLPGIAYSATDIADPSELRPVKVKGNFNLNFTKVEKIELLPLNISIQIAFLSNNLTDYLNFFKVYWSLVKHREFQVVAKTNNAFVDNELSELEFNCQLTNHSSLSTPAGGKEGKDFDRGKYYVSEGSFEVNTYAVFSEMVTVIRDFNLNVDWGTIKIGG